MQGHLLVVCHNCAVVLTGHLASQQSRSSAGHYYKDHVWPPCLVHTPNDLSCHKERVK